ncbi:hypothetical protein QL285_022952 [Trifolium repens]|nr:hypothetical protein QL285_022952 [Trifolium repens]
MTDTGDLPKEPCFLNLLQCLYLFCYRTIAVKTSISTEYEIFRRVEYRIGNPYHMQSLLDWFISRSSHYHQRPPFPNSCRRLVNSRCQSFKLL